MPSSLYLLLPPVLASIRLLSPTLKTIPLRPTYRSSGGFAIADSCLSLLPMKSNYKLLVDTLKSKLNPKASQVAAFDEFQKAAFMIGESMRSFAHRLQLLLDHACNYSRQFMIGAEITSLDEPVDRAQLLASLDGQLDTQTTATTHEISALMEEMKRKIDNSAERLDQTAIHNQAHGAAATLLELRRSWSSGTELPFWKALKVDGPGAADRRRGPQNRKPLNVMILLTTYGVVGGYRARILFHSDSAISLICKSLLYLTNCDKNISGCGVVLLTASGEEVNPWNSITLPLQLGSFDGRYYFVVMDSLLTDVSLGTDFMTKYGICIDLDKSLDDRRYFYPLPPNTSSLIQPMDQAVIQSLKKRYRKELLRRIILSKPDGSDLASQLKSINLKDCCYMPAQVWESISGNTLRTLMTRPRILPWLSAVFYYAANFTKVQEIIGCFEEEESAAVKIVHEIMQKESLRCDLKRSETLVDKLQVFDKVIDDIHKIPGKVGEDIQRKCDKLISANKDLKEIQSIAEVFKGKSNAQLIGMNIESAVCFKYEPVTSAEVERRRPAVKGGRQCGERSSAVCIGVDIRRAPPEYDMEVVHRRGRQHNNADAMSRRPEVTEDNGDHPTTEMPSAAVGTAAVSLASNEGAEPLEAPQDESIECVIRFLRRGRRLTDSEWRELHKDSRDLVTQWKHLRLTPAGQAVVVTGKPARWVPPNYARPSILEQLHNGIGNGHLGAWCDRCKACARRKTPPILNRAPMESLVVGNPMEIVAVELLRPAPRSKNGNSYIMVVTDYFTRWVEAYALPNQQAETVARKLMQQFVCRFGTSMKLLSDQGTQFQGRLVPELCKVCFAYNASVHETTGYAPFEMMLGRPPRFPVDEVFNTNFGKRNDHQQIRQKVGSLPPKCVRGRPETQCGGTEAAKESHDTVDKAVRDYQRSLRPCELTSAQLCSLRQKYIEDKQQVRRDHQSKTKPRIYRPRLVWDEEDHGHDGTSTQAMVAQRPQRNRYPPVRYNDYVFY
ncbi:Gypsy retrotransposon integrase-like protein 1 [Trichinella nativa]|uniref:Gypsy retrotransposon integrase-like protein 1 n=1 Tax=Trichinella nativa TaxID=6335 RepID=A0A0V1KYZ7_9BILA|nr:Gypsy retrotransposon integrase-like protein 1 [Trichinella nativa]